MTFDEFFEIEHDPLVRMCWAMVTDRELARDVAQEAMCRAYERWEQISGAPDARPAAWCRTVALNLIRSDWRRRRTASTARLEVVSRYEDAPGSDPELLSALRSLAARQREAVVLHHLLDLDVASCAAVMDVSASSVKAHLQRGRAHLEQLLGDQLEAAEA